FAWRTPGNEAMLQRRTVHIPDVRAEAERFPDSGHVRDLRGVRTFLATPLLREGAPIQCHDPLARAKLALPLWPQDREHRRLATASLVRDLFLWHRVSPR